MAQIQKGTTYGASPNNVLTATNLNAHVDDAVLLPGAITDQTAKTAVASADTLLVHSSADVALRKTTAAQLFATPQPIGSTTPSSGAFTSLSTTGQYKAQATAMGSLAIDCSAGNYFTITISSNSTFSFSNVPSSCVYTATLRVKHDSGTISWPASVRWPKGTAPVLTTSKTHIFVFITEDGGTLWRAAALINYAQT